MIRVLVVAVALLAASVLGSLLLADKVEDSFDPQIGRALTCERGRIPECVLEP